MKTADRIAFVADENGWEMHVTDDQGFVTRYNIHGIAWNLPDHADATIGAWRREGLAAATADPLLGTDAEAYEPGSAKWLATVQPDMEMTLPDTFERTSYDQLDA